MNKTKKLEQDRESWKQAVKSAHRRYIESIGNPSLVLVENLILKLLFLKNAFGEERVVLSNEVSVRIEAVLPMYIRLYLYLVKNRNSVGE